MLTVSSRGRVYAESADERGLRLPQRPGEVRVLLAACACTHDSGHFQSHLH